VIFGLSYWPPFPIPGFENALGLDPGQFLFVSPGIAHELATGEATFATRVPRRIELMGLDLAWQALTLVDGRMVFSNTASARVSQRFPETPLAYAYDGLDRLVRTVDPLWPVVIVRAEGSNVAPFQIVPQDLGGIDIGPPLTIVPGTVNTLGWPGAERYVARMPFLPGETARFSTTLAAQDEWQNHQPDAEWCAHRDSNNKYKYQLPSDQSAYCITIMAKAQADDGEWYPSNCKVNWEFRDFDHNGSPVGPPIKSGTMDGYQCRIQCLPARAGGQPNMGIVVWCDSRPLPNVCRFRIQYRAVKDCSECPETGNYDCR
jgi:hypothetical protein